MSTQWEINPFVGMNELKFGLSRPQIREMLSAPFRSFRKGPHSTNETDSYDAGFHLYYDENDNLEFIETFSPCDIRFEDMTFLGKTLSEVLSEAKEHGIKPRLTEKDSSCFFEEQGIALYLGEEVEAVSIYPRGYYEKYQTP